tara:strand:- start:164 stop:553 length:390 start_codon:yes stop_codon:yes gene_type:complete
MRKQATEDIEKTFKFYDIFDNKDEAEENKEYCYVTINVKSKLSGGKPIFDISYNYTYSNNKSQRANPFNYSKNIQDVDMEGVIVYKNSLTEKLVEYLMMDREETEKVSGGIFWLQYKIKIMETLANFWD